MVRWSDLAEGLRASPQALLRPALWLRILRRLLFSRVAAGYLLLAGLAAAVGHSVFAALGAVGRDPGSVLAAARLLLELSPGVKLLAAVLLAPWLAWALHPPVAHALGGALALPPPLEQEPPFWRYLAWTVGPILLVDAMTLASLLAGAGATWPWWTAAALLAPLLPALFVRTALASHYSGEDIQHFLAGSRRARLLVGLPLLTAAGIAAAWLPLAAGIALVLLLDVGLVGAALLACGRVAPQPGYTLTALDSALPRGERPTLPMTPAEHAAMCAAWQPRARDR